MTFTLLLAACSPFNLICKTTNVVAASAFQSVVDAMSGSAGQMLKALMTFWVSVDLPDLGSPSGVTFWVNGHLGWLVSATAVFSVLIGAGRLAVSRRADVGYDVVRMLVRTLVTAVVAVPVVSVLAAAGDAFATWILSAADVNSLATLKLAALSPGTVLIGDLVIILTSLFQMAVMVMRGAVVAILVGLLPVTAATTNTAVGKASFAKLCGWLGAFLLIKPAAALVYAAGLQLESQTSAQAELSGIFVLGIAVFALPALIKLLVPAAAAVGNSSGGALTLAAAGAAATGAIALAGGGAPGAARARGGAARSPGTGGAAGGPAGGGGGGPSPSGSGDGGGGASGGTGSGAHGDDTGESTGFGVGTGGGGSAAAAVADGGSPAPAVSSAPAGPSRRVRPPPPPGGTSRQRGTTDTSAGGAAAGPGGSASGGSGSPAAAARPPGSPGSGDRRGSWGGGRPAGNPWVISARQVADNARAAATQDGEPGLTISGSGGDGQ